MQTNVLKLETNAFQQLFYKSAENHSSIEPPISHLCPTL